MVALQGERRVLSFKDAPFLYSDKYFLIPLLTLHPNAVECASSLETAAS